MNALNTTAVNNPSASDLCPPLGDIGMSESAHLAPGDGGNDGGAAAHAAFRGLQHWTTQQRRTLRYKTTSQPLMKLSTLVIVLLAFLIIGFIVLSPLFHYLM